MAVGPLDGIRIVDTSSALSGPWAGGILADQGAEVVKVEPPGIGDIGRGVGPAIGGVSAMARIANRGKRSIAIDREMADHGLRPNPIRPTIVCASPRPRRAAARSAPA